jgi:hypothetical protein
MQAMTISESVEIQSMTICLYILLTKLYDSFALQIYVTEITL